MSEDSPVALDAMGRTMINTCEALGVSLYTRKLRQPYVLIDYFSVSVSHG